MGNGGVRVIADRVPVAVWEDYKVIGREFRSTMNGVSFEPTLPRGNKVKSGVLAFWDGETPGRTESGLEKDRSVHTNPGHDVFQNFARPSVGDRRAFTHRTRSFLRASP
jgi:hypothetical protein